MTTNVQIVNPNTNVPLLINSDGSINVSNSITIGAFTPLVVTPTDKGGTITAGGTAQVLAAANASRKGLVIQNPATATENLYIAVSGSATVNGAGNFAELVPGGSAVLCFNGEIIQGTISVNAATTGHVFIATEVQ
jgi:hypothetical protein